MKRVKAACILQTLVFSQKAEFGYSKERALKFNRDEVAKYISSLESSGTKYKLVGQTEDENGSITLRVKKQYSANTDIGEYFE